MTDQKRAVFCMILVFIVILLSLSILLGKEGTIFRSNLMFYTYLGLVLLLFFLISPARKVVEWISRR